MSITGKVGPWELKWKAAPTGPSGRGRVEIRDTRLGEGAPSATFEVAFNWRRDRDGMWLELPQGVFGYDIEGEQGDDGQSQFQLFERGTNRFWQKLSYLHAGEDQANQQGQGAKKGLRVRAQMPGQILRIRVTAGDRVERGQSLLVMEAMKMENEIRAPQAGIVGQILVTEGQTVETGADLCKIEPEKL